ncbi:MAG: sigma-70 family RNA polymerase sigma factor [Actinobacteria bacterium]|nr:sigma-70 family RNA polymerase sigma factor [Actinomycetota bacterium]
MDGCTNVTRRPPDVTMTGELVGEDRPSRPLRPVGAPIPDVEWIERLTASGSVRVEAVAQLHDLMLRATRFQVSKMPEASMLGAARRDEIAHSAADEATVSALARLDSFEGRSRFTTWAYKFGILRAGVEVRRYAWRGRDIELHDVPEPATSSGSSPESQVEGNDLAAAVRRGLGQALTEHQRHVAVALLIDEIPIDILAERMGTTRNALYKTLHDARKRLRSYLESEGFPVDTLPKSAIR